MATAAPTIQKQRGAYYTPRKIADFLVRWAVRSGSDRVLDPSCGDAIFLEAAKDRLLHLGSPIRSNQITGFEIDAQAADDARRAVPQAEIVLTDFFTVSNRTSAFDAVVGNPPYIRYHYFTGDVRARALQQTLSHGVSLSELTSSWAPFLVHAVSFLSHAGRLAFVLPMELLVTDYASPIRMFLQERFSRVDIITFEERVFPEALVDAVLVLAEGSGPGSVYIHRLRNTHELDRFTFAAGRRTTHAKWSNALIGELPKDAMATASQYMQTVGEIASVDIGVVTGANGFFLLSEHQAREHGLAESELRPVIARAQHMPGLRVTEETWQNLRNQGQLIWMFTPTDQSDAARRYIALGESSGVSHRYKCRVRKEWWRLSLPHPPDLVLSYMSNHIPRMVENRARVLTTNLLHNVRLTDPTMNARWIALSWMNSATMLSCELNGRAYGGGVLKLETREAERVLVPRYDPSRERSLEARSSQVEELLKSRRFSEIADLIDPIVLADIPPAVRLVIKNAWLDLQQRRRGRAAEGKRGIA